MNGKAGATLRPFSFNRLHQIRLKLFSVSPIGAVQHAHCVNPGCNQFLDSVSNSIAGIRTPGRN
jgi:hypothetical protein